MSKQKRFGGRTRARVQALQLLFQAEFKATSVQEVLGDHPYLDPGPLDPYAQTLALGVYNSAGDLDAIIANSSQNWALYRMPAIDRNLLRIALYEMLYVDEVETPVAIDECVELARAFATQESPRFVNGLLGKVADQLDEGIDVKSLAQEALKKEEEREQSGERSEDNTNHI